jgi:uncharacterized membrane protein
MLYLALAFSLVVLVAGRLHGLRALVGLSASLATVIFFVVPAIADGKPPLQVAAFGGLGVMLLTIPLVQAEAPSRSPRVSGRPRRCFSRWGSRISSRNSRI